jgi:hypothetical protein
VGVLGMPGFSKVLRALLVGVGAAIVAYGPHLISSLLSAS